MNSLIDSLTKNLKPCPGCGTNLANPFYDQFWQPKDKNAIHRESTNSSRSRDTGGSGSKLEAGADDLVKR